MRCCAPSAPFDGFRGGDANAWLLTIVRNCWRSAGAASRRRGHTSLEDKNLILEDVSPEDAAI